MSPETCGTQLLLDLFSKTSTGVIYKALPLEGPPEFRLVQKFDEDLANLPEADRAIRRHAKQWLAVRDINVLNLVDAAKQGEPLWYACEYRQGRLLSDVLERCKHEGIPLAVDQSVYLAERLAGSLQSVASQDLSHGCMTPEWILVTFEGEVKILPGLCRDVLPALSQDGPAAEVLRRYHPAGQEGQKPSRGAADIYAVGALLFEFLIHEPYFTGAPDFDPLKRLEEARKGEGATEGLPANLFSILKKSLLQGVPDSYPDLASLKADLDQLITSGEYSPTTFNIAFLMHSLFRGEDETESNADQALLKIDRSPYKPKPAPVPIEVPAGKQPITRSAPAPPVTETPAFGVEPEPSRKGLFIGAGVAAAVILVGVLGYFAFLRPRGPSQAETQAQEELKRLQVQQAEMTQRMKTLEDEKNQLSQRVETAKTEDERAKAKKALEDAQKRIDAQKEEQARLAAASPGTPKPPASGGPPAPATPASSQPPPTTAATTTSPPPSPSGGALSSAQPAGAPPATTPAEPAVSESPKVKPGDFVELWAVDLKPQRQGDLKVTVTPAARQNRLSGTIYVEVTIDEAGRVVESKVVRGLNPDYGMNDVCREAASRLKYTPAVKEGVPVRTKLTFPIMIK